MPNPPAAPATLPLRVVVLASEQLVPTLQFLLHVANRFGPDLRAVHIYHTDDQQRSADPARRLRATLQQWAQRRNLRFQILLSEGGMWPQDVRAALLQQFQLDPEARWVVNITGGTKPMAAAATELTLSTDLADRRVIYLEMDGRWVELALDESDNLTTAIPLSAATDPCVPPPDTLERLLPLHDLVATQFSDQHIISAHAVHRFNVNQAVPALLSTRWHWKNSLAQLNPPVHATSSGDAFERFIGAGLQACGLHIGHSLKVSDDSKVVREVDLVGCHDSRLFCIDIKLPGAEEHAKGTQLADVAELAHSLGGRAALAVAVRPGWQPDQETITLATALRVKLLTQREAPQLFSTLLRWLAPKLALPEDLLQAEQMLQEQARMGRMVLSDGSLASFAQAATPLTDGVLHLPNEMERLARQRQRAWALAEVTTGQYRLHVYKNSPHAPADTEWVSVITALERHIHSLCMVTEQRDSANLWSMSARLRLGVKKASLLKALEKALPGPA